MKKAFALLLVFVLFSACYNSALAVVIQLPANLSTLGEESFYYDTSLDEISIPGSVTTIEARAFAFSSVRTVNFSEGLTKVEEEAFYHAESLESVVLPETVKTIGSRAFAGCASLSTIQIPDATNSIAEDAFLGTDITIQCSLDSSAYEYALTHQIPYKVTGDYSFINIEVEKYVDDSGEKVNRIIATVNADKSCRLCCRFLDDEQKNGIVTWIVYVPAHSVEEEIITSMKYIEEGVYHNFPLPEYFVIEAWFEDSERNRITEPFTFLKYTSAYQAFEAQTPNDFPGRVVLDYGDAGFAVFSENMKNVNSVSRNTDGCYSISSNAALRAGDCVYWRDAGGETQAMKIAQVKQSANGVYTVVEDQDTCISDFYDVLHINTDSAEFISRTGRVSREIITPIEIAQGVSVVVDLRPTWDNIAKKDFYHFTCNYDRQLLGINYIELDMSISLKGNVSVNVEVPLTKEFKGIREIPTPELYDLPGIKPFLQITFPYRIALAAEFEVGYSFSGNIGFRYIPLFGVRPYSSLSIINDDDAHFGDNNTIINDVNVKLEAKFGINFSFGLRGGLLERGIEAGIDVELGLKAQTKAEYTNKTETEDYNGYVHACELCVEGYLSLYIEAKGRLSLRLTCNIEDRIDFVKIPLVKETDLLNFGSFYYSIKNEAESIFGGKSSFGWGKCPNCKYRLIVITENNQGEVKGIPCYVTRTDMHTSNTNYSGKSPFSKYVYPGIYTAGAEFPNRNEMVRRYDIEISNAPQTVTLYADTTVSGTVTYEKTGVGVEGVEVTCGTEKSSTDKYGNYEFSISVPGKQKLSYEKDGIDTFTTEINVKANEEYKLDLLAKEYKALSFAVGSTIQFGSALQSSSTSEKSPVDWIIVEKTADNSYIAISKYILDYGKEVKTWSNYSLITLSDEEKQRYNYNFSLFTYDEAKEYEFGPADPTAYALTNRDDKQLGNFEINEWWLNANLPIYWYSGNYYVCVMQKNGEILTWWYKGYTVGYAGIRPKLTLSLKNSYYFVKK